MSETRKGLQSETPGVNGHVQVRHRGPDPDDPPWQGWFHFSRAEDEEMIDLHEFADHCRGRGVPYPSVGCRDCHATAGMEGTSALSSYTGQVRLCRDGRRMVQALMRQGASWEWIHTQISGR